MTRDEPGLVPSDGDDFAQLERLLRPPVQPLAAPEGRFEQILLASRRRRRRALLPGLLAAAAVTVVAVGGFLVTRGGGGPAIADHRNPPSASTASTPSRGPTAPVAPGPVPSRSAAPLPNVVPGPQLPRRGRIPAAFAAQSVTTASSSVVYVLGDAPGCATAPCTSLVRSDDAGRTWGGVRPPVVRLDTARGTAPAAGSVRDVRFASPFDGWLYGGALWSTHDGSASTRSWHQVPLGGRSVLDLTTDGESVWALVARCAPDACRDAQLLRSGADADRFRAVSEVAISGWIDPSTASLAAVRGNTTLVVTPARLAPGAPVVSRTWAQRSARVWRGVVVPGSCASSDGSTVVAALSPGQDEPSFDLVVLCAPGGAAGSTYYSVARSTDSGSTWTAGADLRLASGRPSLAVMSRGRLAATSGETDTTGWIQLSSDQGSHWSQAQVVRPPSGWGYVGAAGGARLVALTSRPDGNLWTSTDAGAHWTASRLTG